MKRNVLIIGGLFAVLAELRPSIAVTHILCHDAQGDESPPGVQVTECNPNGKSPCRT